jgi:hypothetical protein
MTSRASSCCVGSCRPTRHPELHFAPTCLPSCSTVEVVARLRRQCSRWRSRCRRHAAPPASGPCAAVREEALLPTAAVAGPVCRRPGVLTPPLPPASGPSAGEPVWGGRHLSRGRVAGEGPAPCSALDSAAVGAPPLCRPPPSAVSTPASEARGSSAGEEICRY